MPWNKTGALTLPVSTEIQTALDGKSNVGHTHGLLSIPGLDEALSSKAKRLTIEPEWPLILSHRGGGDAWPETSREAIEQSFQSGFPLEVDIQTLADGTPVLCHDEAVDRTMNNIGTGRVDTKTLAQWRNARIKPAIEGSADGTPMTLADFLDTYGGRVFIILDIKGGAPQATIDAVAEMVLARSLETSLVAMSNTHATCLSLIEAGLIVCRLLGDATAVDVNVLWDAGIRMMATGIGRPQADVTAWKAKGMKVICYGVRNPTAHATALAKYDGLFSDDPWWTTGRIPAVSGSPFDKGHKPYGMQVFNFDTGGASTTATQVRGRGLGLGAGATGNRHIISMPWAGEHIYDSGNARGQWEFDIMFNQQASSQNAALGFLLATGSNTPMQAGRSGQAGFLGFVRRNGTIELFKYESGQAGTQLSTASLTSAVAADGEQGAVTLIFRLAGGTGGCYMFANGPAGSAQTETVTSNLQPTGARLYLFSGQASGTWLDVRKYDPYA